MNPELNAVLERLLEKARANAETDELRGASSLGFRCSKCRDAGWILRESGTFETVGGNEHVATERQPVAVRCSCRPKPQKTDDGARSFA